MLWLARNPLAVHECVLATGGEALAETGMVSSIPVGPS